MLANIAVNLKNLRVSKDLSQRQLAEMLSINPSAISAWESGRNLPKYDHIEKLAAIYEIDVNRLFGDDIIQIGDICAIYKQLSTVKKEQLFIFAKKLLAGKNPD
ncbi:helix-turn-helix domain-containing protein [Periweissella fabalis]|uniref:Helix-turn-helix transcriptional regulator n=1 Tax=Periweissella fabalis TaxID=1070421 RepID=A0A7X6S357_9LACO|nr:helix-turn-helix transcriptional regulator [Periweissella fabalis]MCM0598092.1 helix-turn-helix transcriptional regulator [Periweissella fabalis]NKZ24784.1 helix-turn-helix transcriptional regulator [Periweissella fabalis]